MHEVEAPRVPTAIYVRMSQDRTGAGLGVERQERECRELVALKPELDVVQTFVDNDVSATGGKPRPQYQALLKAIQEGRIRAVVAWHTDRLHRSPLELEDYIAANVPTYTVMAGPLDLATPSGRMTARMAGAVARHEIELKSERQKSKNRQIALSGVMPPGGAVPFGFNDDRTTHHPVRGPLVQSIHRRVLRGEALGSVIRSLNEGPVPAPRGGAWNYSNLRNILLRPLNAGLMFYDAAILDVETHWDPLVSLDEHYAMVALLRDPSRRTTSGNKRKHLLAGIARCANCHGPLRSGAVGSRGRMSQGYRCGNRDCPAPVHVNRDRLDALVVGRLLAERGEGCTRRAKPRENAGPALQELENKIRSTTAQLGMPSADIETLFAKLKVLRTQRDELSEPQSAGFTITNLRHDWDHAADVESKRALLVAHLDDLLVASRGKTSHRFDPERVTLTWQPDRYDEASDLDSKQAWS